MSLDPVAADLFAGGHVVHLTTLRPDGSPQSRPVWTILHDGDIVFFTQEQSAKAKHIRNDPRVALSVADRANSYRSAWARGHVATVLHGEEALAIIDRISHAYIGEPFPMRSGDVYVVETEASGSMELPFRDR